MFRCRKFLGRCNCYYLYKRTDMSGIDSLDINFGVTLASRLLAVEFARGGEPISSRCRRHNSKIQTGRSAFSINCHCGQNHTGRSVNSIRSKLISIKRKRLLFKLITASNWLEQLLSSLNSLQIELNEFKRTRNITK